jgi:hypothetical protein
MFEISRRRVVTFLLAATTVPIREPRLRPYDLGRARDGQRVVTAAAAANPKVCEW